MKNNADISYLAISESETEDLIARYQKDLISLRHDIHRHPELSNREFRTADSVIKALEGLGLKLQKNVAHTGVVALLEGGQPGPVIALRADMDALPITEQTGLPFASTQTAALNGSEVGVMHACGHDAHTSILVGVAKVLSSVRNRLPGTVKFIFQPAEEGPPDNEEGGAKLMVEEGVLTNPSPEAIFGLHVSTQHLGTFSVKPGPAMAGGSIFTARIIGKQTHAAMPWSGIDPVVLAAQIILGWQTIPSRQANLRKLPAPIISVGQIQTINGRNNIIPSEVTLEGTVRVFNEEQREEVFEKLTITAQKIAESAGGFVEIRRRDLYPPLYNDPALTDRVVASLERIAPGEVEISDDVVYGNEDFAYFTRVVPGVFFTIGATPRNMDHARVGGLHSPTFFASDDVLAIGVRSLIAVTLDFLFGKIPSGA